MASGEQSVSFSSGNVVDGGQSYSWGFGEGVMEVDFSKAIAVIIGLALAAAVSAATLTITEPLPVGEYTLVPVAPPPVDSDTDGFPDDVDACPDEYGVEPDGCPLPLVDTDDDGIPDDIDACPTEPAQTDDGCPLPPDADNDGVPDDIDQCADTPDGDEVDSVGCTVTPPDPGDLAATPIGQLAATVPPGETRLLPGNPAVQGYGADGSGKPQTDEWTSNAYWYPQNMETWFHGLRVSVRIISYKALTDTWTELDIDGVENAPARFPGPGHAYETSALDTSRGHFYVLRNEILHRYVIAEDRWEQFEGTGMDGQIIEWNDSLDMLINHNARTLIGFRDGQTFTLPDPIVHGYHSSARFNKVRGDMLMLGGNYSLRTVALMLPDGTIEQRADLPVDFSINSNDLTYDPVTGNYIVSANHTLYEYSPDLNEWREAPWKDGYPLHNYARQVPIVIDELGIIAWQTINGLILHRHESVFVEGEEPSQPVAVEPEEPAPPVLVEYPGWTSDGSLLVDQAATMEPGEWRNIANLTTWPGKDEGVKFKSFQYVYNGQTGADGMGWTQDLVYDHGRLLLVLNRSGIQRALIGMNSDGTWWRVDEPEGLVGNDRRPFNKLNQDDTHLYFSPNGCKECMGYFVRTPLDDPGVFERYGIPIGDDQMDSVGNFAVEWVPEWGRFYAYTPGGKLWTWTHGETEWTLLDRLKGHFTGYAGVAQWNPVKKELAIGGGQYFGGGEDLGNHFAVLTEPMGTMQIVPDLFKPDGSKLSYTSAEGRLIVDPRDGSYFLISGKQMYHSDTLGGMYEHYADLGADGDYPLGKWEMYAPYHLIPGTDVLVFVSHIEGVVLHRLG